MELGLPGESMAIFLTLPSVNQTLPVASTAINSGKALAVGRLYSLIFFVVALMLPTLFAAHSVNQRLPSCRVGDDPERLALVVVSVDSAILVFDALIVPILSPGLLLYPNSANHRFPSGP